MTTSIGAGLLTKLAHRKAAFANRWATRQRLTVDQANLQQCQEIISYRFANPGLLEQALTHASAAANRSASNERLEFLGDAVLSMVICQEIYDRGPDLPEGELTKIKSSVVSRLTCARVADEMGLTERLRLGKGVRCTSALPMSLAAAVLESVIGAIYLDGGLEAARTFILTRMGPAIELAMASQHQRNYKSVLQQYAQRLWTMTPQYDLLDEKGPEHAKCFEIAVSLSGRQFTSAWGNSKKTAEQKAALTALKDLGVLGSEESAEPAVPDEQQ